VFSQWEPLRDSQPIGGFQPVLRKCQPARWSAVMVSARWRIVLGSPVAGSAIVPAIQPAERRFALGAG